MVQLSPEEKQKIYEEEKAKIEAQQQIKIEMQNKIKKAMALAGNNKMVKLIIKIICAVLLLGAIAIYSYYSYLVDHNIISYDTHTGIMIDRR